jgi:hypothetical protein
LAGLRPAGHTLSKLTPGEVWTRQRMTSEPPLLTILLQKYDCCEEEGLPEGCE